MRTATTTTTPVDTRSEDEDNDGGIDDSGGQDLPPKNCGVRVPGPPPRGVGTVETTAKIEVAQRAQAAIVEATIRCPVSSVASRFKLVLKFNTKAKSLALQIEPPSSLALKRKTILRLQF